ncbi:hypothetical protein [Chitiniphilus eburneus]|uniref:Uncharacterized protein n=1 Tax=Chitiniphilus eburneus TaxID=2571148 RepID=A0A4U0PXB9_9NEIS|nr:hypothetical protein [Chitiniphilus eburneus]TJZ67784.1 hypothetical protein FAZ21_16245 [Chitiniphilus eburneus]
MLIRPEHQGDAALLAHELEHTRQWWWLAAPTALLAGVLALVPALADWRPWLGALAAFGLVLQGVHYLLLPPYRRWSEIRAYRITLAHAAPVHFERTLRFAAHALAHHYWLRLSEDEARRLLLAQSRTHR